MERFFNNYFLVWDMFTFAKEKILKNNMSRSAICRITLMKLSRRDFSPKFLQRPIWSYKLSKISLKNCLNFLWSKYLNVLLTPSNWLNPTSQCCYYKTTYRALSRGRKSLQGQFMFSKFLFQEKKLQKAVKIETKFRFQAKFIQNLAYTFAKLLDSKEDDFRDEEDKSCD